LFDLSLAEKIINIDDSNADVGGDTGHTPDAFNEFATYADTSPAGDNAAHLY